MFKTYEQIIEMTDGERKEYKKEMKNTEYFVRTKVHYYDFATGLISACNGGKSSDGIDINAIFRASPWSLGDNLCQLDGKVFECIEFLSWVNGDYDSKKLKELNSPDEFTKPTEFTVEVWTTIDKTQWKLTSTITFEGVEWKEAFHGDEGGGDRCCAGHAKFTYQNMYEIPCDGEIIKIPAPYEYSNQQLLEILKKRVYKGTMLENKF